MKAEHASPEYYVDGGLEVWDIMEAKFAREEFIGFLKGNILKYLLRAGKKSSADTVDDVDKLLCYAHKLLDVLTGDDINNDPEE